MCDLCPKIGYLLETTTTNVIISQSRPQLTDLILVFQNTLSNDRFNTNGFDFGRIFRDDFAQFVPQLKKRCSSLCRKLWQNSLRDAFCLGGRRNCRDSKSPRTIWHIHPIDRSPSNSRCILLRIPVATKHTSSRHRAWLIASTHFQISSIDAHRCFWNLGISRDEFDIQRPDAIVLRDGQSTNSSIEHLTRTSDLALIHEKLTII